MHIIDTSKIKEKIIADIKDLKNKINVSPTLAIVRVGENKDDIYYEKSIIKKCDEFYIKTQVDICENDISNDDFLFLIKKLNKDNNVKGIIVLRPLPKHLNEDLLAQTIDSQKDIDCLSYTNIARLFTQYENGFLPCTPQSVMEIIDDMNIDLVGKKVCIVGAGMAVGRPLAMLMMNRHATISVCRSKTKDLVAETKQADIVIAAMGKANFLTEEYFNPDSIVIDVGINYLDNKMVGDVDFENVKEKVQAITPVPNGVGILTTYILIKQLLQASI